MEAPIKDITVLLKDWQGGNRDALDQLIGTVYQELMAISKNYLSREARDHTLGATGLVNEAYMRLVDQNRTSWQNRAHFFAVASRVMRQILMNYARDKKAAKRGGDAPVLQLDLITDIAAGEVDLLGLDDALEELAKIDKRKVSIVEMKFFGGLGEEELAEVLDISVSTVRREWRAARSWLRRFLKRAE